ncbi:hypothetical protein FPCIR_1986 [Fusarium pseudocircinatum]|uniref:Uncharacterized protein n=1 Tax=Fusarium pseudocircinatum TaxID=56676 RepID=A0A8H5PTN2_9HYPO|nr:hypothetical protein FPCIR_1986 [Fusarium pseudocircinatum]
MGKLSLVIWRIAHPALRGDLNEVKVDFTLKERDEKHCTGSVILKAVPLTFATCEELKGVGIGNRIALCLTRLTGPGHKFNPIAYDDCETAKESRRDNLHLHLESALHGDMQRVNAIYHLINGPVLPAAKKRDPQAILKWLLFNKLLIGRGLWDLEKDEEKGISTPGLSESVAEEVEVRSSGALAQVSTFFLQLYQADLGPYLFQSQLRTDNNLIYLVREQLVIHMDLLYVLMYLFGASEQGMGVDVVSRGERVVLDNILKLSQTGGYTCEGRTLNGSCGNTGSGAGVASRLPGIDNIQE